MNFSSDLSKSEEYQSFRASVPLKKVAVDPDPSKIWKIYDAGPKSVPCPLVCLAPVSGTADVFFKQILYLTARGIRVISVESPVYWTPLEWCDGFRRLLDQLDIQRVHLFGASLGGFLAQKFAEYTSQYHMVSSIVLCNSFIDTSIFNLNDTSSLFWIFPAAVLRKLVLNNITSQPVKDLNSAQSTEFIIERLDTLTQQELASRLMMNCVHNRVDTSKLQKLKMTIIDVFDEWALTFQAKESVRSHYSHAKLAHLKAGGNFPYLSCPDDINLHLLVHLRQFSGSTRDSAQKPDQVGNCSHTDTSALDYDHHTSREVSDHEDHHGFSDSEEAVEAN